jgi:3-polyprenyl-4-hydroxybenzoate decarboxylase
MRRLIIAITGATGAIYASSCCAVLRALRASRRICCCRQPAC